jgi:hypothetical protein
MPQKTEDEKLLWEKVGGDGSEGESDEGKTMPFK